MWTLIWLEDPAEHRTNAFMMLHHKRSEQVFRRIDLGVVNGIGGAGWRAPTVHQSSTRGLSPYAAMLKLFPYAYLI